MNTARVSAMIVHVLARLLLVVVAASLTATVGLRATNADAAPSATTTASSTYDNVADLTQDDPVKLGGSAVLDRPDAVASGHPVASSGELAAPEAAGAFDDALTFATRAEKLDHIFVPKHNLDALVQQLGSREAVVEQMLREVAGRTPASGVFEISTTIGGQSVVVRGAVVDGVAKLGTAFTP